MVKRMLRSVLFVTLMTYGGLCIYALLFADKTIFQPGPASYAAGDQWLTLSAGDGTPTTVAKAEPVKCWQSVQWHTPTKTGSASAL